MSASIRPSLPPDANNYLLFSDVHLGADLVQHARPWTISRLRRVLQIDRDLSAMLDHYREHAEPGRPWKLIIAGDLVDFVGMSIAPIEGTALETPLTDEERTHGLGTARDHALLKMRACAARHDLVFQKLAQFVAAGHSLVLVRGNHDVDFYWETARAAFVQALVDRAGDAVLVPEDRAAFEARVDFRPWFYYVEGLLYVEHGHQYDETCAYPNWLMPLSPRDKRRLSYSFSDILMRYVVRPTRGMSTEGHDHNHMMDYVRMALAMGIGGALRLGYRYVHAAVVMFRAWRDHISSHARELRAEHDRHVHELSQRVRVEVDKLRALADMMAKPITLRPLRILSSLFLDLLIAGSLCVALVGAMLIFELLPTTYVAPLAVALATGLVVWQKTAKVGHASDALRRSAARVAQLLPTRFVVMGHTHEPTMEPCANGATYVNLGGWAVDDLDAETPHDEQASEGGARDRRAPCTHLVIRHVDGKPHAELRRWDSKTGPSLLASSAADDGDSGVRLRPEATPSRVA